MGDETQFKLPNRDGLAKISGNTLKLALLGGVGLVAWYYLAPILLALAWTTLELGAAVVIGAVAVYIFSKPKLWRAINYYSQFLAEKLLNLAIEMNPFAIMENQIDKAQDDREDLHRQSILLKGQQAKITDQITNYNNIMRQSAKETNIIQRNLATVDSKNQDDVDKLNLQLETTTNKYTGAKDYIDGVQPILNSINLLVNFADKAYDKSGNALENARMRVKMMKDKYDAVTTGSRAMAKAQAAFTGRPELNADAEKAMDFLRKDIGNKIGAIRESIKITSNIMDSKDLADAAKAEEAAESAQQFNLDDKFKYSAQVEAGTTYVVPSAQTSLAGNRFLTMKK